MDSKIIDEVLDKLHSNGMNTFDLLTWECKLRLIGVCSKDFRLSNAYDGLVAAAKREADHMDKKNNSTFHNDLLKAWQS